MTATQNYVLYVLVAMQKQFVSTQPNYKANDLRVETWTASIIDDQYQRELPGKSS